MGKLSRGLSRLEAGIRQVMGDGPAPAPTRPTLRPTDPTISVNPPAVSPPTASQPATGRATAPQSPIEQFNSAAHFFFCAVLDRPLSDALRRANLVSVPPLEQLRRATPDNQGLAADLLTYILTQADKPLRQAFTDSILTALTANPAAKTDLRKAIDTLATKSTNPVFRGAIVDIVQPAWPDLRPSGADVPTGLDSVG